MKYPKFLQENNTIGVPAPSNGASSDKKINRNNQAIKYFKESGFNLVLSKNINKSTRGRSASSKKRGQEINDMFSNNEIDIIMCLTGGEFLIESLPYVDYSIIKEHPKLITGFSDSTGLLYTITTKYDIATIYGHNLSSFGTNQLHKSHYDFLELIKGERFSFDSYDLYESEYHEEITGLESYNLDTKVKWKTISNKNIEVEGRIIGGCLDIISSLAGTKYDGINEFNEKYKNDGIIWYFDNCELSCEEVIRTLWKLNELNYFKYTKAVIFGRFGVIKSCFDYNIKTCLEDSILTKLNIEIIYDADISHKAPCLPVVNGSIAKVRCFNNKGSINYIME